MATLNSIDVTALKASAEAKLTSALPEKKAALKEALGPKLENTGYTTISYNKYSEAYDAIVKAIDDATDISALNAIDVSTLRTEAEAKLTVQSENSETVTITTPNGSVSKDVVSSYEGTANGDAVYSVDVIWTDLSFTYSEGTAQWNPDDHEYNSMVEQAGWADEKGEITVINHSNAAVDIKISFERSTEQSEETTLLIEGWQATLSSAEGTTVSEAPSHTAIITASGVPTSNTVLGKLVVSIEKIN